MVNRVKWKFPIVAEGYTKKLLHRQCEKYIQKKSIYKSYLNKQILI